jgi:hypothetical protein
MRRILIVARTRMRGNRICIGGHDLDRGFRSVRLLDAEGRHWMDTAPFAVGDLWQVRYRSKHTHAPHVEDVMVDRYRRLDSARNPLALILAHAQPWTGPPETLFDGTVHATTSGSPYIPGDGALPRRSTGYWIPQADLACRSSGERVRFEWTGGPGRWRFAWVGVATPPPRIPAGSLVRVSLSRLFSSETAPEGYYVQISGVLGDAGQGTDHSDLEVVRNRAALPGLRTFLDRVRPASS